MLMAVVPTLGQAIGLGQINVRSALDEPLFAEISFTSLSAKERKKLKVELASRAEFSEAGISRPAHLTNIKFDTVRHADGRYYLQLRTDQPYREPFLHLLLKAEWAGGRLIREYTALIDPPYLVAGTPVGVSAPTVTPAPVAQAPQPEPIAPTPVRPPVAVAPPPVAQAQPEPQPVQPKPAASQPEPKPEPVMAQRSTEPETLFGPQTLDEAVVSPSGWPLDERQTSEPAQAKVEALVPADRGHEATIADMEPPADEIFGPPVRWRRPIA